MDTSICFTLLLFCLCFAKGWSSSCANILPDSFGHIVVEVGKKFTATCHLREGSEYTSNDLEWTMKDVTLPKNLYHIINETSVSITINITNNMDGWLKCKTTRKSLSYIPSTCMYGISLKLAYPPLKPTNVTCIALQKNNDISSSLTCKWDPGLRDTNLVTNYTLNVQTFSNPPCQTECGQRSSCTVDLSTYPVHVTMTVWVEVKNELGSERSEEIIKDSSYFVKPNPPLDVQVKSEVKLLKTLLVSWKPPIDKTTVTLLYVIRYRQADTSVWTEVPENIKQETFRLQYLDHDTEYVVQIRCTGKDTETYWSDWSDNAINRTPEAKPESAPDLWRIIQPSNKTNVTLIWKPPAKANGKILQYSLEITKNNMPHERRIMNADEFKLMLKLLPEERVNVEITASNSAGVSPKAALCIRGSNYELPGVKNMSWWVSDEKLQVEWSAVVFHRKNPRLFEYLLEWQNETEIHWQRVSYNVTKAAVDGKLDKCNQYNISVYPIYKHNRTLHTGKAVTMPAYLQQEAPKMGPIIPDVKSKKNSAELKWEEIPLGLQCGFIRNYTIFYKIGNTNRWQSVTVDANIHSYVLTDLVSNNDYVVRIMASTDAGSKNSSDFNFKTVKYGDGEVEVIVVVVCFSFLFLSVFIIMLCLRKREVIKKLLWPQVPDPSDSSIAHWSPDFPIKADMPKENVSVVEVDVFDGKSLCEEDKGVLPLKKDKYLSEEHSSGIGGSSCMSSPRHSVSDSDEGDSGQTTSSTVQYSSVVASGYKGQTPNHQPPVFARSESTQPLLDCEEHPDHLSESTSQAKNSYFRRGRELEPSVLVQECNEPNGSSLTFCPVQEEEASPVVEDPPTAASYMPQQSGYRPQ